MSVNDVISTEALSVEGLFKSGRRFDVPRYQRSVVWERGHVWALVEDTWAAFKTGKRPYFIGPFTFFGMSNAGHFEIIDGQQRLTTLSLIFKCLGTLVTNCETQEVLSQPTLQQGYAAIDLIGHEYAPKVHHRNEDERDAFREQIIGSNDADVEITNIQNAHSVIQQAIYQRSHDPDELADFIEYIRQKVSCVLVIAHSKALSGQIFETFNERGKKLEQIDLIRNSLFMRMHEEDQIRGDKLWEDLRKRIGEHVQNATRADSEIQRLFNYYLNIHQNTWIDKKLLHSGYLDVLKSGGAMGSNGLRGANEILDIVCGRSSAKAFVRTICKSNGHNGSDAQLLLALKSYTDHDVTHPLVYAMFCRNFSAQIVAKNLKIFGCLLRRTWAVRDRLPIKQLGSLSSKLAHQIYFDEWDERNSTSLLRGALLEYDSSYNNRNSNSSFNFGNGQDLLQDEVFKQVMLAQQRIDASKAREIFIFILNHFSQSSGEIFSASSDLELEHILPRSLPRNGWKFSKHEHLVNFERLGNLMLLSREDNEDADQLPLAQKLEIYKNSNYFRAALLDDVDEETVWSEGHIDQRQARIVDLLTEIWSIDH